MGLDRPEQDRDGVSLVVIRWREATGPHGGDDDRLVGVALARDEALDRADRHALVGNAALLAPGGQRREKTSKDVCRVDPSMFSHLFEIIAEISPASAAMLSSQPRKRR